MCFFGGTSMSACPPSHSDNAGLFATAVPQARVAHNSVSWLPRRLECTWVGAGLADVRPYPLTHALGFNLIEAAEARSVVSVEAPQSSLTAEQITSGRRWSAKVVLMSGMRASALHAADPKDFQVTV